MDHYIDSRGTHICLLSGGLNGPGEWFNYLCDIGDIVQSASEWGANMWFVDGESDCLDDVFYFKFGISQIP